MLVGNYAVEVKEKNHLGGGIVEVVEGDLKGKKIGFSKFDGFTDIPVGQAAMAFVQIGRFASVEYRRNINA